MLFDGKKFAREIEALLRQRLRTGEKRVPKIFSILVGDDPASALYTRLKSEAAKRCGIEFEVIRLAGGQDIAGVVRRLSETADGIMVQLPLPGVSRKVREEILEAIPLEKDVDGLRWEESGVKPATVRAVLSIVDSIAPEKTKFVVLGARGSVGRPLVYFLRERGVEVSEVEWDTPEPSRTVLEGEVIISCVGKPSVVTGEMVRDGVIAIDVGMSMVAGKVMGDMTPEVYQKASVAVPVPNGVGPVTIACLLKNVWEIYDK